MRYSFILPVYNVEKYLCQCIDSIIMQDNNNYEIILIDDGSSDKCPQICDRYAQQYNQVKVIHKTNGGVSEARNLGIEKASGDFLIFVDSDDSLKEGLLDVANQIIESNPKVDIIGFGYERVIDGNEVKYSYSNQIYNINKKQALEDFLEYKYFNHEPWGKIFSRRLFSKLRFPNNRIAEDLAISYLWMDKTESFIYIDKPYYLYLVRGDGYTGAHNRRMQEDAYWANEHMYEYFNLNHPDMYLLFTRRFVWSLMNIYNNSNDQSLRKKIRNRLKKISYKNVNPLKIKLLHIVLCNCPIVFLIIWNCRRNVKNIKKNRKE